MNKNSFIIVIVIISLFIVCKQSLAQTQENPPSEVIEKYESLKLKITQLNEAMESTNQALKDSQVELSQTVLTVNELKQRLKDETIKINVKEELKDSLKDLEKRKTRLESKLQLVEIGSEIKLSRLQNDLSEALKEKAELELRYSLVPTGTLGSKLKSYFLELKGFISSVYLPGGILKLMAAELFRGFSWGIGFFSALAIISFIYFARSKKKES